jgi:hypothetical protein
MSIGMDCRLLRGHCFLPGPSSLNSCCGEIDSLDHRPLIYISPASNGRILSNGRGLRNHAILNEQGDLAAASVQVKCRARNSMNCQYRLQTVSDAMNLNLSNRCVPLRFEFDNLPGSWQSITKHGRRDKKRCRSHKIIQILKVIICASLEPAT